MRCPLRTGSKANGREIAGSARTSAPPTLQKKDLLKGATPTTPIFFILQLTEPVPNGYSMDQSQHKIMLIEPPFYRLFKSTYSMDRYPLSLGYLAGAIKKQTHWSVSAYNADFCAQSEWAKISYMAGVGFDHYLRNLKDPSRKIWTPLEQAIIAYQPTVVGISAKSPNFASACRVAELAKKINEKILVIMGGPHVTMVGAQVMKCRDIDVAVKGEGERTIVELLNAFAQRDSLDDVKGIIYRKHGQIIETAPREFIEDLDTLCFPHETAPEVLIDYDQYPRAAFKNIFTIRGCPHDCFFCGSRNLWSRKVRFRSPENIIQELKGLQNMGIETVHFDDDTFGVTPKRINSLCNAMIRSCSGLRWSCDLHVKLVDEPTISLMKEAGCYAIQIGIESGNDQILREMRKNITVQQALHACEIIKKHDIILHAFFIVGFPQETEDTLNDTVAVMEETRCDYLVYSIFTPYPGTEAFDFCKVNGLIDDEYDVSLYNHQSPANCFCTDIAPERFREIVARIEKMIDQKNYLNGIKRTISLNTVQRVRQLGLVESFNRGVRILTGK